MHEVKATVLFDAPTFPTWAHPATHYSGSDLYMCFETHEDNVYSIVLFGGVIEYRIQPLTDESIWKHQYFAAGLKSFEFHLLTNSPLAQPWPGSEHWVITFKDETHDVVAKSYAVISKGVHSSSTKEAIQMSISTEPASDT